MTDEQIAEIWHSVPGRPFCKGSTADAFASTLLSASKPAAPAQSRDVLTDSTLDEVCRLATHCGLAEFRARARILLTAPQPAQSDAVAREISGLDPLEWGGDGGPHEQRLLSQRGVEQSAVVLDDERIRDVWIDHHKDGREVDPVGFAGKLLKARAAFPQPVSQTNPPKELP